MANTTDTGFAPAAAARSDQGAAADDSRTDTAGTPPFGDPDQRLYGGGSHRSSASEPTPSPNGANYEGRHRAVE